ncbi:39S ribosomal protein L21, mitochondrial [Sitodiplosis mosellana]|uniref:39S ribosomal protein L21, mitochondrial n=1 Tax=Sitodiplosis mosellana TaxID=263140 RepID=UPI002443F4E3|nr:39S ribosomal protein L21, mitochondrial [Sitodiplosis mosellana]
MFMRRLFNLGRQLAPLNISSAVQNFSVVQKNTLFQSANKVEFLKKPIVEKNACQSVISNVNNLVNRQEEGRLFAVVHLCGKQYKVTAGDIVVIEGYWAPTIGDNIRLEKVLLVGGDSFTLTGRPLVQPNIVDVQATVVEKTIAHTRTTFKKKRRKQYMRIKFHRSAQSMIRINSITINPQIDINSTKSNLLQE